LSKSSLKKPSTEVQVIAVFRDVDGSLSFSVMWLGAVSSDHLVHFSFFVCTYTLMPVYHDPAVLAVDYDSFSGCCSNATWDLYEIFAKIFYSLL